MRVILFDLWDNYCNVVSQEFFVLLTIFLNRIDRQL